MRGWSSASSSGSHAAMADAAALTQHGYFTTNVSCDDIRRREIGMRPWRRANAKVRSHCSLRDICTKQCDLGRVYLGISPLAGMIYALNGSSNHIEMQLLSLGASGGAFLNELFRVRIAQTMDEARVESTFVSVASTTDESVLHIVSCAESSFAPLSGVSITSQLVLLPRTGAAADRAFLCQLVTSFSVNSDDMSRSMCTRLLRAPECGIAVNAGESVEVLRLVNEHTDVPHADSALVTRTRAEFLHPMAHDESLCARCKAAVHRQRAQWRHDVSRQELLLERATASKDGLQSLLYYVDDGLCPSATDGAVFECSQCANRRTLLVEHVSLNLGQVVYDATRRHFGEPLRAVSDFWVEFMSSESGSVYACVSTLVEVHCATSATGSDYRAQLFAMRWHYAAAGGEVRTWPLWHEPLHSLQLGVRSSSGYLHVFNTPFSADAALWRKAVEPLVARTLRHVQPLRRPEDTCHTSTPFLRGASVSVLESFYGGLQLTR